MQNHLTSPTSSLSHPEANILSSSKKNEEKGKRPRKAPWKGKNQKSNNFKKKGHGKSNKITPGGEYGKQDQECYRCGMKGHWSRICRTPKHTVKLYQELSAQLKQMKNEHEANFVSSQKFEIGESSKSKEMEIEAPKPEKNETLVNEEEAEDMLVGNKPTNTVKDMIKNFETAIQEDDDDDDLLGEELDDMHGDSE